jgi:hypothetical protein
MLCRKNDKKQRLDSDATPAIFGLNSILKENSLFPIPNRLSAKMTVFLFRRNPN